MPEKPCEIQKKTMRSRSVAGVIAAAMLVSCLAGCKEDPIPQPAVLNAAEEVISPEAYADIAQETLDVLASADQELNPDALGARLAGPMYTQRSAQYALKKLREGAEIPAVVIDPDAVPISSGAEFPRSLVSYSAPAEGQNQRTLTAWQRSDARSNYRLWGQIVLFPHKDLPTLASTLSKTESFPDIDAQAYLADPAQVAEAYAAYLTSREAGSVPFQSDDPFYLKLGEHLKTLQDSVGEFGQVQMNVAGTDTAPVVVKTDDGGLVAMYEFNYDVVYTSLDEERPLTLKDSNEALMFSGDANQSNVDIKPEQPFTAHYTALVGFYIPLKDKGETVNIIGASSNVLLSASAEAAE